MVGPSNRLRNPAEGAAVWGQRSQHRGLDEPIGKAKIALAQRLLDGALLSDLPCPVGSDPDATQRSVNLGSGDAVEESADVQSREASIVEVPSECGNVAAGTEVVKVMRRPPAAADLSMHCRPRLPTQRGGDEDLWTLREYELVIVGSEHRTQ